MNDKERIIKRFRENVKGKRPMICEVVNKKHDGREGHWLETQMGLTFNADNAPDLYGYEMKNNTNSKTTFGDWSADYYIYKDENYFNSRNRVIVNRDKFLEYFGKSNPKKGGRFSWSGEPFPKTSGFNSFGQVMVVDKELNILAQYSYSKDLRADKITIVPAAFRQENLILAKWNRSSIASKLERKFNQNGWFKCVQNNNCVYDSIVFGKPMSYGNWIELVREGIVFLDSGMHQGNPRPYSNWRANNSFWESLIDERYI